MAISNTESGVSAYVRSYNSFSGVDIKANFANKTIGELQAISVSITREKAPIYTMGSADPRGISRGKRGIAGTLIFIMLDRDALLTELNHLKFQSDKDDIRPEYLSKDAGMITTESWSWGTEGGEQVGGPADMINMENAQQESALTSFAYEDQALANPWYADQIPPFDITLAAANEYGALAVMKIFGVEVLNEGFGVSIDDIVVEQQYTYICRNVVPWQWIKPRYDLTKNNQ